MKRYIVRTNHDIHSDAFWGALESKHPQIRALLWKHDEALIFQEELDEFLGYPDGGASIVVTNQFD